MTRESAIEVTLPGGRKIRFRPRQVVHTSYKPLLAIELNRTTSILSCCIESQEPHGERE